MKLRNVLYISYDGLSDNLGQSQILPYLIRISKNNIKYQLLTCDKPNKLRGRRNYLESQLQESKIKWNSINYHRSPPLISTWYDLKAMYNKANKIISEERIDLIHCRSYPAMSIGIKLKRKYGVPLIFDMRGFYPEERVEGGIWNLKNILHKAVYRKLKKQEIAYLKESDAVVSLTHKGKEDLLGRNINLEESKIWVVPCAADYDHFKVIDEVKKSSEMVYLGSIGTWYLLDEMLQFFKIFQKHNPNWKLRFITTDNQHEIYQRASHFGIPHHVIDVGPCLRENLPLSLNQAKASLFFIKPTYSKTASYPTKLPESLACGLPIICNQNVGDLNIFAEKYPFVKTIKLDQKEYEETAQHFETWNNFSPDYIREKTRKECGLDGAVNKYMKIYNTLLEN